MPPMDQKRFQKFAEKFHENLWALRGDSLRAFQLFAQRQGRNTKDTEGTQKAQGIGSHPAFYVLVVFFFVPFVFPPVSLLYYTHHADV